MLQVTFYGVRGSTPVPGPGTQRFGGNTSCVVVEGTPHPIVLDLGTGVRAWGDARDQGGGGQPLHASVLVTHLHFDHVQGLPFFEAVDQAGSTLEVFGPPQEGRSLTDAFADLVRPPYFPIRQAQREGTMRVHDVHDEELTVGEATVVARTVPHLGPTNGYRVSFGGVSMAYVSDHQAPAELDRVPESVLELADGVDLLIHDAQFTPEEWQQKPDWGHSTVDYAVLVAREAGARRLALFHHDPKHDDDDLDRLLVLARRTAERLGVDEVLAAAEGQTVTLGPVSPAPRGRSGPADD